VGLRSRWHGRRPQSGFTMVEILVVIIIAGILAGIAAPGWFSYLNSRRLDTGIDELYIAMREAQSQAIRTKRTWQVSFREQDGVLQWSVYPSANPEEAFWESLDANVQIDDSLTTLPEGGDGLYVRFNHRGWLDNEEGDFDVLEDGTDDNQPQITVMSAAGGDSRRCAFVATLLGSLRRAKDDSCDP